MESSREKWIKTDLDVLSYRQSPGGQKISKWLPESLTRTRVQKVFRAS